jgi:hypothetical protein
VFVRVRGDIKHAATGAVAALCSRVAYVWRATCGG